MLLDRPGDLELVELMLLNWLEIPRIESLSLVEKDILELLRGSEDGGLVFGRDFGNRTGE